MSSPIPQSALTQHIAILGKTGSGKSSTAKSAIVEPLLAAGAHVCVIDPTSAWWGLRLKADGKTPTNQRVIIIGGERGDIGLAPNSGAAIAQLVAEQGVSVIVDTGGLTVGEYTRWMIDFAGTLYTTIKSPLHLIIDEAHQFAPQGRVGDVDSGKMLHAVNRLMSGGRSRGIRAVLITQRPAKLHKDSLTCCDSLLAHRVIAPQDRAAIKDWVDGCGDATTGKQVMDSLASLAKGECWVWYPEGSHLQRVKMPLPKTFDSSAAPDESKKTPALAKIDLAAVNASMDTAIREAEDNDPKRLRARIAEFERGASEGNKDLFTRERVNELVSGERDAVRKELGREFGRLAARVNGLVQWGTAAKLCITNANAALNSGYPVPPSMEPEPAGEAPPPVQPRTFLLNEAHTTTVPKWPITRRTLPATSTGPGTPLAKAERSILTALAQRGECSKRTLALSAGYAVNGGGFGNALSKCRSSGWIEGVETIRITTKGEEALGPVDPLPSGKQLLEYWLAHAGGKAERLILETLAAGGPLTKAELANRCGYAADGGGFGNALSRLRTLCLVEGNREITLAIELRGGK